MHGGPLPTRSFEDSAGIAWEVFEVQRSSHKATAVSAGMEHGWLAFVSARQKRRLAPFPTAWHSANDRELERLCGVARVAKPSSMVTSDQPSDNRDAATRVRVPRIRRSQPNRVVTLPGDLPIVAEMTGAEPVEQTVRTFAQQARARGLPAIEAMVQLKALLGRVYTDAVPASRDHRVVRHWFVDSYYFDGSGPARDAADQSR